MVQSVGTGHYAPLMPAAFSHMPLALHIDNLVAFQTYIGLGD
jgi:hypothetical protein